MHKQNSKKKSNTITDITGLPMPPQTTIAPPTSSGALMGFGSGPSVNGFSAANSKIIHDFTLLNPQIIAALKQRGYDVSKAPTITSPDGFKYEALANCKTLKAEESSVEAFRAKAEHIKLAAELQNIDLAKIPIWFRTEDPNQANEINTMLQDMGFKNITDKSEKPKQTEKVDPFRHMKPSKNIRSFW